MNFGGRKGFDSASESQCGATHRGGVDADENDRALLRAHLAGDRRAFAVLAQRHYPRLMAMARRYQRDDFDPMDGVQEGLTRAMASAAGFRGGSTVATWLTCIVKNACIDHNRGRFGVVPVCGSEEDFDARMDRHPAVAPDLALRVTMAAALRQLPAEQRDALLYLDIFGYSLKETSRSIGQPSGTLKSRRARARIALRRRLEGAQMA